MLSAWSVTILAVGYVGLLFAVARFGERHAARLRGGRWEPLVYALSLGVWCTSWAFYGSVGHAAGSGFGFVLTYIGPALMLLVGFPVLQKIARTAPRTVSSRARRTAPCRARAKWENAPRARVRRRRKRRSQ